MPFSKPLPRWDKIGTEPPESLKVNGWQVQQKPPADYFNHLQYTTYQALKELQEKAQHKDDPVTINDASLTQKGVTQLSNAINSTSETTAATPKAVKTVNDDLVTHKADNVKHITPEERTAWNSKETPDGARKKVEQTEYKKYKSNKDSEGIFTTVEYKRNDGTLAVKAVLSGGTSPKYTTRTHTYYGLDGTTVEKTTTRTLSYDADDVLVSEV